MASFAGVKVRAPASETLGWTLNRPLLSLVVLIDRIWLDSLVGPALRAVAHPGTVLAAEFSSTVSSTPTVNVGASFTAVTVIVIVCGTLVSSPPFATPPLSWSLTETVAVPLALAAGVYVRSPLDGSTAGWTLNRALLSFVTMKFRTWPESPAPSLMLVAQAGIVWDPESSSVVSSPPPLKLGTWLTPLTVIVNVWMRSCRPRRSRSHRCLDIDADRGHATDVSGGGVGQGTGR